MWRFHATIVAVGSSKYVMASSRVNVTLSAKQASFTAMCRIRRWPYAIQIPCGSSCRPVRVRVRIARPGTSEVGTRTFRCHNSSACQGQRAASTTTMRWHYSIRGKAIQSNLGSRTPRIMNDSVYEQIFRTQSVSDDYCVSSYEHASRQHRGAISWEYQRRQYS